MQGATNMYLLLLLILAKTVENFNPDDCIGIVDKVKPLLKTLLGNLKDILKNTAKSDFDEASMYVIKYANDGIKIEKEEIDTKGSENNHTEEAQTTEQSYFNETTIIITDSCRGLANINSLLKTSLGLLFHTLRVRPKSIIERSVITSYVIKYAKDGIEIEEDDSDSEDEEKKDDEKKEEEKKEEEKKEEEKKEKTEEVQTTEQLDFTKTTEEKKKHTEETTEQYNFTQTTEDEKKHTEETTEQYNFTQTTEDEKKQTEQSDLPETTTELSDSCREYIEKPSVGNIRMTAPWPDVAISWHLNEGVSQDCFAGFDVQICQKEGTCMGDSVGPDVRNFWTPVQNVTFYYSSSVLPILNGGSAGVNRSMGHKKLNVCPGNDASVRNPTWTVTSNNIALSWLAPDAPAICIDHYFVTVIDERGKTTGGIHLKDTHYTQEGLMADSFYEIYITVFYSLGGMAKTALGTLSTNP